MAANPFLFTDDDYTSPHSTTSNPFLSNDDFQAEADNPFFSQSNNPSTNPFAFDPEELESTEPQLSLAAAVTEQFGAIPANSSDHNLFSVNDDTFTNTNATVQKPTDLDLKYTNTVDGNIVNDAKEPKHTPMPPPRPPPSKETQDLLMSVMGAMDATSSHLLDRIPPTRTPSPVSMRDLHSPSPTPEPSFGDLLDVSDSKPINKEQEVNQSATNDLLSLSQENVCDINQNPPVAEPAKPKEKPTRPGPPSRPPRPQPPQKPPPPSFVAPEPTPAQQPQPTQPSPPQMQQAQPPPKPPPPSAVKPKSPMDEMMDMFGNEDIAPPAPKAKATKDDILNLYNKPKTETVVKDLLCDDAIESVEEKPQADMDVMMEDAFESASKVAEPVVTEIIEQSIERVAAENVHVEPSQTVEDAFLSPEPQIDVQMDTSDSQSKDSLSSATFNPFASSEETVIQKSPTKSIDTFHALDNNAFQDQPILLDNATFQQQTQDNIIQPTQQVVITKTQFTTGDSFDAFAEKFESAKDGEIKGDLDAFSNGNDNNAWGSNSEIGGFDGSSGFDADGSFDAFLAMQEPAVPKSTPNKFNRAGSESDEDKDFSVFIKPSVDGADLTVGGSVPVLAPPPVTPVQAAFTDSSPRFNPFDQVNEPVAAVVEHQSALPIGGAQMERTDSQETPPTPLYDEDMSQPLEPFPRTQWKGDGWEMHLRQPNKKKITGQRFWKKIFVRLVTQADCVLLQLFNQATDKDPFQELPLQPCYSVSDIGTQQYDQYGKIFTLKLQYIFYKERPGVRPGQVKKAERITNKLSQFAAYAIQGDYQGVKEFGSDLKKLGLPVEHAPQVSQLMKLGSLNYEDLKQFSVSIEEALFTLQAHRDRALHYKMEEVQITVVDELYVEQSADGCVDKQIARVRLLFLGFLTGMPDVELGINDMRRQGKEVVGRHDIIPVITEEWIRLEAVEFHNCVQQDEYNKTHIIKFKPPDACYIELLRFRVRPPKNRELPLQLKASICVTGNKIELRADVLVPGFASRKLGQVPCEDVMIRFPIPECWIYMFRVEKHFRYGSVKSAHRRTGKIKGIERILGTVDTLQESLIEVTSGQAKYEHQHRAIVWRCPRLPKEGQGAYTTHNMVCRLALTSFDQMPEKLAEYCYVEFTMPATQVSHTTVRSVSLQNTENDDPPEKYVRYLARHEYRVGIEHVEGDSPNPYAVATVVKPAPVQEEPEPPAQAESSSDSD